jgi:hypothetical protein
MRDDSSVHRDTQSLYRGTACPLRPASAGSGQPRFRALVSVPAILAILAGLVGVPVTGTAADAGPGASRVTAGPLVSRVTPGCQRTFVPAFPWSASLWTQAMDSRPAPGVMILNVTGVGAGNVPVPHFQALVRRAHAHGVTVLGYSSTEYGQRPPAAVEADARNYKAWYKANGMFLDLAAASRGELPYYRRLASYIRRVDRRSVIWLNPGAYPDQAYLQAGNVLVVFEGSYATYRGLQVPGWVAHYKAARFADVIYSTPGRDLAHAVRLARLRRAGYVYVTDLPGSPDPYSALPSYWTREVAAVAVRC